MTFVTGLQSTATRLLSTYGQAIDVVRDNIGDYNELTGAVSDTADTNYSGYGYPGNYDSTNVDGVLVQQNDIRLIFRATTAPLVNDIFTVGDIDYTAISVRKITASGSDIIYIVQLRQ